jgi:hypothetical protein
MGARKSAKARVPFGEDQLRWFPAGATLCGAVDLKAFGPAQLDGGWARSVLRLALPAGANDKFTPEIVSGLRIDGVSLAYYEGPDPAPSGGIVQLEGQVPGGREKILKVVRAATTNTFQVDDNDRGGGAVESPKSMRVSGPALPLALGVLGGDRVFLARSAKRGDKGAQHLRVLERLPIFDFSSGPWPTGNLLTGDPPIRFHAALAEVPWDASGFLVGDIPAGWPEALTEALSLRVCPNRFIAYLKREGEGVALSLTFYVDRAGAELLLQEELERWRRDGLDALQTRFPKLRDEPEALALVGQTLKVMRWGANTGNGSVSTRVQISGPTIAALGRLVGRVSRELQKGQQP